MIYHIVMLLQMVNDKHIMKYKGIIIDDISLLNHTKVYFELLCLLLVDILFWVKQLVMERFSLIAGIFVGWLLIAYVPLLKIVYQILYFMLYWILLGVASSVGLGTGLHTFVLYLGPHIARLALTATMCGKIPEMLPSRWNFDHFGQCKNTQHQTIGFMGILLAVQFQSFLWGLGTAIGELPPYFVAKKAAQSRAELKKMKVQAEGASHNMNFNEEQDFLMVSQKQNHKDMPNDEIQEIVELKTKADLSFVDKIKLFIFDNMQKYGFWAILCAASIPNPLFDLAGIASGHFRIPFKTFFSATFIGKAIIKVHIQMFFVIALFRKQTLDLLVNILGWFSKNLSESFYKGLEQKKKQLNEPKLLSSNSSILSSLWDIFITGMVLFFVKSILDAYIKQKAIQLRDG